MSAFAEWLWGIISGFWSDFVEFVTDIPLIILDSVLSAIASILESIPVPDFISSGLSGLSASVDPGILYFIDQSGIAAALSLLGAGVTFRLLRKLFTLGQW